MKLSDRFIVNEDSAVTVEDQVYNRVNFESNIDWARRKELPKKELDRYHKKIGIQYLLSKQKGR